MKKGILFRDTPYSKFVEGGSKWFKTGDEKTQVKYEGNIVNGVPKGQGIFTYPDGEKYVGEFKDGQPNGQGTFTFPDGRKYEGEWKDGVGHGQGTYTWSNGNKYVGEWGNGLENGQGTFTSSEGDMLISEFKDGQPHGQGTKIWTDGRNYIGEYKDGKMWNGTLYHDLSGKNPESYVNGTLKTDEDVIGNGLETLTFVDGKYVGELKDGILHGQGTYTWSNGDKYVGEWKDGKMTGQGTFTYHNGTKYEGEWKDNKKWTGKKYDKNGNIQVMIVNGKEIKPVEEETADEKFDRMIEEYNAYLKKKYPDDKNPCDSRGEKSNRKYSGWERDPAFRRDYRCNN